MTCNFGRCTANTREYTLNTRVCPSNARKRNLTKRNCANHSELRVIIGAESLPFGVQDFPDAVFGGLQVGAGFPIGGF